MKLSTLARAWSLCLGVNVNYFSILYSYYQVWHTLCPLSVAGMMTAMTTPKPPLTHLLKELIQIGIALTSERNLGVLLERIVAEARRFTNAEAGTLFLREGSALRFAVVQNEVLEARLGRAETHARLQAGLLPLDTRSLR